MNRWHKIGDHPRASDVFYAVNDASPWDTIMQEPSKKWIFFSGYPNRYNMVKPHDPTEEELRAALEAVFSECHRFQQ